MVGVCVVLAVVLNNPEAEPIDERFCDNVAMDDSEETGFVFTRGESVTTVPGVLVVLLDEATPDEESDVVVLVTVLSVGPGDAPFIPEVEVVIRVVVGFPACARGNAYTLSTPVEATSKIVKKPHSPIDSRDHLRLFRPPRSLIPLLDEFSSIIPLSRSFMEF